MHSYLSNRGVYSKVHIMVNECSSIFKDYLIHEKNVELMLVLLYLHYTNTAKKAIDIFKLHS